MVFRSVGEAVGNQIKHVLVRKRVDDVLAVTPASDDVVGA